MTIPTPSPTVEAIQITSQPNLNLILVIVLGISSGVGLFALALFCFCVWLRRQYLKRSPNFTTFTPLPHSTSQSHLAPPTSPPATGGGGGSGRSPKLPRNKLVPTPKRLFPSPASTLIKQSHSSSTTEELLNKGFLYIKPPANTLLTQSFVCDHLLSHGFHVSDQRIISGSELMSRYSAFTAPISHKALVLSSSELEISLDHQELFESKYGISWKEAAAQGLIHNAQSTGDLLQLTNRELYDLWSHASRTNCVIQLAPDCWVALLEHRSLFSDLPLSFPPHLTPGEELLLDDPLVSTTSVFCINGFFPEIRDQYLVAANTVGVWCCNVSWSDSLMSWQRCLAEIIGHPNPVVAQEGSLRRIFLAEWSELEQQQEPTIEDNAIHFSSSAFEACAERELWMDSAVSSDPLGSRLSSVGLTPLMEKDWLRNGAMVGTLSVYEQLEGFGCLECLRKIQELLASADASLPPLSPGGPGSPQGLTNSALLLFSPEASAIPSVLTLASELLTSSGCLIASQGELVCSQTLSEKFDSLHPVAAKYALSVSPSSLQLAPRLRIQFQKHFQTSWTEALSDPQGGVLNAAEAMRRYRLSAVELYRLWCAAVQRNQSLPFSSALSCASLEIPFPSLRGHAARDSSAPPQRFFCVNGFYPHLRGRYQQPPPPGTPQGQGAEGRKRKRRVAAVAYLSVEWDPSRMPWSHFNRQVIGELNASLAEPSSLRGQLLERWAILAGPSAAQLPPWNGFEGQFLFASRSAWDGLRERSVWLGSSLEEDPLGQPLLSSGICLDLLTQWTRGNLLPTLIGETQRSSLLSEIFLDKGIHECLALALELLSNTTEGLSLLSSPALLSQQGSSPQTAPADPSVRYLSTPSVPAKTPSMRFSPAPSPILTFPSSTTPRLVALTPLSSHHHHPSYPPTPFLSKLPTDINSSSLDSIPERSRQQHLAEEEDHDEQHLAERRRRGASRDRASGAGERGERREVRVVPERGERRGGRVRGRKATGYPLPEREQQQLAERSDGEEGEFMI